MKTIKRLLASLMVVVIILTAAPLSGFVGLELNLDWLDFNTKASAETYSGEYGDNLTWSLDTSTGSLIVSGTGSIAYYYQTSAPWYSYRSSIKTVTIRYGVTSIGSHAFYGCTNLTSITIPDSVTSISTSAFYGCTNLTSITIPDSVIYISGAFSGCSNITVDEGNTVYSSDRFGVLFNKDKTELIQYPQGNARTSYTIPDGVINIGDDAFDSCTNLTSITIPHSVINIGDDAFESCTSLTSITIPDSVTSIGDGAFSGCHNLDSITIPDSVTSIGDGAFSGCHNLECIVIGSGVTNIGEYAFSSCESLTSISVDPENPTFSSDSDGVLYNKDMTVLIQYPIGNPREEYSIKYGVERIGVQAFRSCNILNEVNFPESVRYIDDYAFGYCNFIYTINFSEGLLNIGNNAFEGNIWLQTITIPDSVTSIGSGAFSHCYMLYTVDIGSGLINIGDCVFWWSHYVYFNIDPENEHFSNDEFGVLFNKDKTKLIKYSLVKDRLTYTVPGGVEYIENGAFDCSNNVSVTLPDSLKFIGANAFEDSKKLTDVYYNGTDRQWNRVTIASGNDYLLNAEIHFAQTTMERSDSYLFSNNVIITPYGEREVALSYDGIVKAKIDRGFYKILAPVTMHADTTADTNAGTKPEFFLSSTDAQDTSVRLFISDYRDYIIPEDVMNSWSKQVEVNVENSADGYQHNAYMQKDRKDGKPYISTVFGKKDSEVEYKELRTNPISIKQGVKYDIIVTLGGIEKSEVFTYYIAQDGERKLENKTGVFDAKVLSDTFKPGKTIYVYAKSESGVTTELQEVKLSIEEKVSSVSDFAEQSTYNLFGKDFAKITIPSSVPLIGDAEISFNAFELPAGFEYDGETLKISIGANIFNSEYDGNKDSETYGQWKKSCFKDWKDLVKTTTKASEDTLEKHREAKDKYKKAKENFLNKWKNISSEKKDKNWDINALGYAELELINGNWVMKDACISVEGEFTFKYTVQGAIWVIPAYCYVAAGAGVGAESQWCRAIADAEVPIDWHLTLKIDPKLTVGGGVGVDDVAAAGVYVNATLPIRIDFDNKHITIQIVGEIGVEAELWVLKGKKKIIDGSVEVLDKYWGNNTKFVTQSNPITGQEETYVITYEVIDRDYLDDTSQWFGDDINFDTMALSQGGMTLETLRSSVFDSAKPQVVSFGDKMLMTWIEDDTSRDSYNRMRLMYSVYDGTTWSEPKVVYDNGCNDNEPVIVTDGEDVCFAWQKLSKTLTEEDAIDINSFVDNCEIYIAKYDSSEDVITGVKRVTDNSVYDYAHNVSIINGTPYVYWVTCNDNNMESGSDNTLKKATFDGTTSVVKSDLNYVLDLDAAFINGKENVSYSMDADGNTLTVNDVNVFTLVDGVSTAFDKQSDVAYTTVFYGEFNDETVLFVSDMSNIYYVEDGEVKFVLVNERSTLGNINYVDNNGEGIFIWTENNGAGNEVYSSTYENRKWTNPIVVSDVDATLLTGIDATMYKDQFRGVCVSTDLVLNEETQGYEVGQTDLCSFTIAEMQDIAVDTILIDERNIKIGTETSFDVYVTNNGSETVNNVTFTITDELGFSKTVTKEVNLASGDYKAVELIYTAPANYSATELIVSVSTTEITDENAENDSTSIEIGTPKIVLSESEIHKLGSDYVINAIVTNESDVTAENLKLKVAFDKDFTNVYSDLIIDKLVARNSSVVEIIIPKDKVVFEEYGIATVYITSVIDEKHSNDICTVLNNFETVCEHPVVETMVVEATCLEDGYKKEMCMGCGYEFSAEVYPATGHSYEVTFEKVPTCNENGYTYYQCSKCYHTYSDFFESKHTNSTIIEEIPPVCGVSEGYTTYYCSGCGTEYTEYQWLSHSKGDFVKKVEPICGVSRGYSVYECANCGVNYNTDYVAVAHTKDEVVCVVEPVCGGESGYTVYKCSNCSVEYKSDYNWLEHTKGEVIQVVDPVCGGSSGYSIYACSNCGEEFEGDWIWLEHIKGKVLEVIEPVCGVESGWTVYECAYCGEEFEDDWIWLDHSKGDAIEVIAPVCGKLNGYTKYKCSNCSAEFQDDWVWLSHNKNQILKVVEPVCGKEYGYTRYRCTCGTMFNSDYIWTDHNGELIDTTTATCIDESYEIYECKDCSEQYKRWRSNALGHVIKNGQCVRCMTVFDELKLNTPSDVNIAHQGEKVYLVFKPEDDGKYYFYVDSATCVWSYIYDSEMNILASYTDYDYEYEYDCAIAYDFKADEVYYLAVEYSSSSDTGEFVVNITDDFVSNHSCELQQSVLPTCLSEGYEIYKCKICDRQFNDNYVDATGHKYIDGICTNCGCHENNHLLDIKPAEGTEVVIDNENNFIYGLRPGMDYWEIRTDFFETCEDTYVFAGFEDIATGSIISFKSGEETLAKYTAVIFGDVNGDGWYDGQDAVIVSCLANGMLTKEDVGEAVYMAADCNHDGVIDQFDVDLLNEAGALLANVDQSKPADVLLETSSEYVEYLELIDQSPEIEVENDTETDVELNVPESEEDGTCEGDTEDSTQQGSAEISFIDMIINFIKSIFEMLFAYNPVSI